MTITQVYVCSDCRYAWCMFSSLHGHSPTHIYASVAEVTTQGPLSHPEVLAIRTQSKHSLRASWLSCLAQGHFSIYFRLWGQDTEPQPYDEWPSKLPPPEPQWNPFSMWITEAWWFKPHIIGFLFSVSHRWCFYTVHVKVGSLMCQTVPHFLAP